MNPLRTFKHLFVAHVHNDHKPHIFRELGVGVLILVSVFILGASFGSSLLIKKTVLGASITASVLIDMTNESRLAYNEEPLLRSDKLDHAAGLKSEDMATKGYFAHNSPEGITPWHWMQEVGYTFLYAGENLAIDFTEPSDVRDAWLASPLHRANLLDVRFKEIGIATREGFFNGKPTIFVVQMFGTQSVPKTNTVASNKSVEMFLDVQKNKEENTLGEVKGETTQTSSSTIEPVYQGDGLLVVKNQDPSIESASAAPSSVPTYSTWYGRIVFFATGYISFFYKALLLLVLFSLMTMLFIEYKKEHWKHISYALSVIILLLLLLYINSTFF